MKFAVCYMLKCVRPLCSKYSMKQYNVTFMYSVGLRYFEVYSTSTGHYCYSVTLPLERREDMFKLLFFRLNYFLLVVFEEQRNHPEETADCDADNSALKTMGNGLTFMVGGDQNCNWYLLSSCLCGPCFET